MRENATNDTTATGLVRWPDPDGNPFTDSGEGGLFAWAVWEAREEWSRCHVEPFVLTQRCDSLVGAHGPMADLDERFTSYEDAEVSRKAWEAAHPGGPSWYESAAFRETTLGPALAHAIYLGSTPHALVDDTDYFTASPRWVSVEAATAIDALERIFGPTTYLTFLDT